MFRVKICGITSAADAIMAVGAGADAVGINFFRGSRRYVPPEKAAPIVGAVRGKAAVVAVFVNERPDIILTACRDLGIDSVQLSGDEPPEDAARIPMRRIKAVRFVPGMDPGPLRNYPCEAFLVDAHVPGEYGGTGAALDWERITGDVGRLVGDGGRGRGGKRKPWILAGGLTPENVLAAIRTSRPAAVDVASGVESSPGKKDPEKVRRFIINAWKGFDIEGF